MTDTLHVPPQTTVGARVRRSFDQSVGSIVFGMEDGTVSIFGLVFGVAADSRQVAGQWITRAIRCLSAAQQLMSAGCGASRSGEEPMSRIW